MKPTYMRLRQTEFTLHPEREQEGVVFEMPTIGQPLNIWRNEEKSFSSSPVEEVVKDPDLLIARWTIKTMNNLYVLEEITPPAYLKQV